MSERPLPSAVRSLVAQPLGGCGLRICRRPAGSRSGWSGFRIDRVRNGEPVPLLEGVFSPGGRGVAPWFEVVEYRPRGAAIEACGADDAEAPEVALFRRFHGSLPPQGHLMLWCEGPEHRDTFGPLSRGVPPALTRLGYILFQAGFPRIRFFDLAEGGWEGEQKLWAERPAADYAGAWRRQTLQEIDAFMKARVLEPELAARARAMLANLPAHGAG